MGLLLQTGMTRQLLAWKDEQEAGAAAASVIPQQETHVLPNVH